MDSARLSGGARHYVGDWIAGGLYILSQFTVFYSVHIQDPAGWRSFTAHYGVMMMVAGVQTVLTVPLLMSLRLGAWLSIAVQAALLLFSLSFLLWAGWFVTSNTQVIEVAMMCYCIARLRNALGPPLIAVRLRRTREAIEPSSNLDRAAGLAS